VSSWPHKRRWLPNSSLLSRARPPSRCSRRRRWDRGAFLSGSEVKDSIFEGSFSQITTDPFPWALTTGRRCWAKNSINYRPREISVENTISWNLRKFADSSGKCPTKWAGFALQHEHLPSHVSKGRERTWANRSPSRVSSEQIVNTPNAPGSCRVLVVWIWSDHRLG